MNITTDFVGYKTCWMCGFPMDKKIRLKMISQAPQDLRGLVEGLEVIELTKSVTGNNYNPSCKVVRLKEVLEILK